MLFHALLPGALACPVSPLVTASAPRDVSADPIESADWYINEDRTIWAGPVPGDGWPTGGVLYRERSIVKDRRSAGERAVLLPNRFQIVALLFPTEGCWEVSARAGEHELTFVTLVRRTDPRMPPRP